MEQQDISEATHALLTQEQAAAYLGVNVRTLEHWRSIGKGPRFVKLGRAIRYTRAALDRFIAENQHQTSAEYTGKGRRIPRQRPA